MGADDKNGGTTEEFRESLREACKKYVEGDMNAMNRLFSRARVPPECDGNGDRTYWFYWMTTVLKTLGEQEGVDTVMKMAPNDTEVDTYCKVALGKPLSEISKDAALRVKRAVLCRVCGEAAYAVQEVLALEPDPILQHSLTALRDECRWCVRELCEKEAGDAK